MGILDDLTAYRREQAKGAAEQMAEQNRRDAEAFARRAAATAEDVYTPFAVGDVVSLKSGGANMTVGVVNRENRLVMCFWHDEHDTPQNYNYAADMLQKKVV